MRGWERIRSHTLVHKRIGARDPDCKVCSYDALAAKLAAVQEVADDYHDRAGRLFASPQPEYSTAIMYDGAAERIRKALGGEAWRA